MAFSEIELKRIDKVVGGLCHSLSPAQYSDQFRFTYSIEGHGVSIWEERPAWNDPTEWTRTGVAKFRFIRSKRQWKLYWMRRDFKWHAYAPEAAVGSALEPLVRIVEKDEHGAFFG